MAWYRKTLLLHLVDIRQRWTERLGFRSRRGHGMPNWIFLKFLSVSPPTNFIISSWIPIRPYPPMLSLCRLRPYLCWLAFRETDLVHTDIFAMYLSECWLTKCLRFHSFATKQLSHEYRVQIAKSTNIVHSMGSYHLLYLFTKLRKNGDD